MSGIESKRPYHIGHLGVHVYPIRPQPRGAERRGRRGGVPIFERVERVDQALVRKRQNSEYKAIIRRISPCQTTLHIT